MTGKILWHQSGVNRAGDPFIQLLLDDKVVCQLSPNEARDHARNVLEATEASEQDAFLLAFARNTIGMTEEGAARLLQSFRAFREARGKKGPPSDPREFVVTDEHKKPGEDDGIEKV